MTDVLYQLGWNDSFADHFHTLAGPSARPARISRVERGGVSAIAAINDELHTVTATVAGRLFHDTAARPAVGDWAVLDGERVTALLPRTTALARAEVDGAAVEQTIAANVDIVVIVETLEGRLRRSRLERYVTFAWTSGAQPVVVLNKADQCADPRAAARTAGEVAIDVPLHVVCAQDGTGTDAVRAECGPGRTAVVIGASGVGKSTLVNRLCGGEFAATGATRSSDGKGRHTTTWREMMLIPGGGVILDTAGLRSLALWESGDGIAGTFGDIEELAGACRFTDCGHRTEPDCAVRSAIEHGTLTQERLTSYRKMRREELRLQARRDARLRAEQSAQLRRQARGRNAAVKNRKRH